MKDLRIDEASRVNLPLRLLWSILAGVAVGGFVAAGVYYQTSDTRAKVLSIDSRLKLMADRLEDHERRLIRIEVKTGIANVDGVQNATVY
jgi:hypothetical protein